MRSASRETEETLRELPEIVAGLGRPRIGVIGDLMLDEYVWGEVERVSPEAPIPVLKVSRRDYRPGGAGSVVVNLARLGAEVEVFGVVGDDEAGERIRAVFRGEGARTDGILSHAGRPTTRKSRHLGYVQHADRAVQQILRVDDEDPAPISDDVLERLLDAIGAAVGALDAVLVSDYAKGLLRPDLVQRVIERAGAVPVLIDPARSADPAAYRGAYLICPNRYEAELASGVSCRDMTGSEEAARRLVQDLDLHAVAVTLDRDGILLCERDCAPRHFPTKVRTVADVTGAGDMVLTVLGLVVASGGTDEEAVRLANIAAGIEVRRIGVTPISRGELLQELQFAGHPAAQKIKTEAELAEICARLRRDGRKVVFTNGCFDLLHRGHHEVLYGASREGDVLVVAVNADASIRRLKGPTRPSIPEDGRVRMLAGLEFVDYVTVFSQDTPNHLLESLRPDVLVKGGEYRDGVVVGREIVEGYGGRIAYVEQIPGHSTTALLGESWPDDGEAGSR